MKTKVIGSLPFLYNIINLRLMYCLYHISLTSMLCGSTSLIQGLPIDHKQPRVQTCVALRFDQIGGQV